MPRDFNYNFASTFTTPFSMTFKPVQSSETEKKLQELVRLCQYTSGIQANLSPQEKDAVCKLIDKFEQDLIAALGTNYDSPAGLPQPANGARQKQVKKPERKSLKDCPTVFLQEED